MMLGEPDESGRPRPRCGLRALIFTLEFDAVMKAIGETPDTSILTAEFIDRSGRCRIDESSSALGKNLFAGGDFTSGPATVVEAIAAGRKASGSMIAFCKANHYRKVTRKAAPAAAGLKPLIQPA